MTTSDDRRLRVSVRCLVAAGLVTGLLASCSGTTASSSSPASRQPGSPPTAPESVPATADPVSSPGADCLQPTDQADVVRFGPDGTLGGFLLGHGGRFVVLAHQLNGDACEMLPLARRLASAGFRPLAFDFSGTQSSAHAPIGRSLSDDVRAAIELCRSRRASSVQLIGASMGGNGVLAAALLVKPRVDAVVSLSAPISWDDPTGAPLDITDIATPVQLWDSALDTGFVDAARRFAREDPAAQLHIVSGAGHGVELVPTAFAAIKAFLGAHLR